MYEQISREYAATIVMISAYVVLVVYWFRRMWHAADYTDIAAKAKTNVQLLGSYDYPLMISVSYWIYGIACVAYSKNKHDGLFPMILEWNACCNVDNDFIIHDAIFKAKWKFYMELDRAKEENVEPEFKVSNKFDYHNVSKTIKYSDYINEEVLMKMIDHLFESTEEVSS